MRKYVQIFREKGFKEGVKAVGWPTAIGLFMFFFIKGMMYIIVPYLIAKGLLG
jgi:hypothetical protein